ncbi:hypothetical protein BX600DRAFT_101110 [Xylariales sp. PMI_506]|nr:hypothetical protein BX600DRAFT_101110 [Xylariales sp. PMI_506]
MASEYLYVVKRTFTDPKAPIETSFNVALPATFTSLEAAKAEAEAVSLKDGYEPSLFAVYEVKDKQHEWKHGDGTIVYGEGLSGEVFKVEIDTVSNTARIEGDGAQRINRPLYHVLQTTVHYNEDRSGSLRDSAVESTHTVRRLAEAKALVILLDQDVTKEDFVEYDEFSDGTESPFGPDVVVHAVMEGGENILVSVIAAQETPEN